MDNIKNTLRAKAVLFLELSTKITGFGARRAQSQWCVAINPDEYISQFTQHTNNAHHLTNKHPHTQHLPDRWGMLQFSDAAPNTTQAVYNKVSYLN